MSRRERVKLGPAARPGQASQLAFLSLILLVILMASGCASKQQLVNINASGGQAVVAMKASDFKFTPNNLKAHRGDRLEFKIENVSGTSHNFTIKNPGGEILKSVDLPPHQTVTVEVDLPSAGTYHFYCAKTLHADFGMKGWLEVTE
jgi:uncharacterized cupredoxin-like copper-binding protein